MGAYLGLGLREDSTIEATVVPASLRSVMAHALSVLRRIDAHVRAAIASMVAGNGAAALANVAVIGRPLNGYLDKAGLCDCGSNQH